MSVKVVIAGCCGRMGSRIAALALNGNSPPIAVGGAFEVTGHPAIGKDLGSALNTESAGIIVTDNIDAALGTGDVLIDFTTPEATMEHLRRAKALKKSMVIGTTGLPEADRDLVKACSQEIPILFSPNMSLGVNVLFELAEIAAKRLGPRYTVELEETHHAGKKDAPSGTAKRLQELIAGIRKVRPEEVPCRSHREGNVVGDHKIIFSGPSEHVELSHHAESRDVFALGALRAALFVAQQPPGLYDMSHVLGRPAR